MQNIQELLIKDQENISLFKSGKISIDEYKLATNEISEKFFSFYKKNGFPSKNDAEVYKAAVVLSLHQPLNNLEVIFKDINSNPNNKVEAKDVAFITDKILVNKEKKQLYGTQYKILNGKIEFLPIESPDFVDKRRKDVGLESLEEYEKKINSGL